MVVDDAGLIEHRVAALDCVVVLWRWIAEIMMGVVIDDVAFEDGSDSRDYRGLLFLSTNLLFPLLIRHLSTNSGPLSRIVRSCTVATASIPSR